MRTALIALLALAFVPFAASPASASTATKFYETKVVADTADDFAGNGALDIVAVHASEKYSYDPETGTGKDVVQFRIEVRNRDQIAQFAGQVPIDFVVGFKANGKNEVRNTTMHQVCRPSPPPSGSGFQCDPPSVPRPNYNQSDDGVTIVVDRAAANLPVGTVVSDIWAATATFTPAGTKVYQDVAPKDNGNQPQGQDLTPPATKGGPFTLAGTFPFLTMTMKSPTEQFVVPGGTTGFVVVFRTHDKAVNLDHMVIKFKGPVGWEFSGNLGNDFTTTAGGQSIEYEFTAKAPVSAKKGDMAMVTMDAIMTTLGGHQAAEVMATVSGPRVDAPNYVFKLTTPGPFKAEQTSHIGFSLAVDGADAKSLPVKADFIQNQKSVNVVDAEAAEGAYEVHYSFPSGGAWTIDLFVGDMTPAPHKTFDVQVKAAGGALPGAGTVGSVVALLGIALLRRRAVP